jgi:hypothetical protein
VLPGIDAVSSLVVRRVAAHHLAADVRSMAT